MEQQPTDIGVTLALADCYDRLSVLTSAKDRDDSIHWLDKALRLRRALADQHTADAKLQALRLDAELRSGVAAGFENAGKQLAEAQQLDVRLTTLWPTSPAEVYHLACLLAGARLGSPKRTKTPQPHLRRPVRDLVASDRRHCLQHRQIRVVREELNAPVSIGKVRPPDVGFQSIGR